MAEKDFIMPLCDVHNDRLAQTICKYHKKLLCLSCSLEEAKSQECYIHEVTNISGEQDITLYEWLLVRQVAMKKRRSVEAHEYKTETLKSALKKEVNELHEKLVKRLSEMKENCLESIDTQAETALAQDKLNKNQLDVFDKTITENIEKLPAESLDDMNSIQAKLNEVKTKIKKEIPDIFADPEGNFTLSEPLEDLIREPQNSLGIAVLISPEYYDVIQDIDPGAQNKKERNDVSLGGELKHSNKPEKPEYVMSDEVIYNGTEKESCKENKSASTGTPKEKTLGEGQVSNTKNASDEQKAGGKSAGLTQNVTDKKREGFFKGLFRKKKSDKIDEHDKETTTKTKASVVKNKPANETALSEKSLDGKECVYQDIAFSTSEQQKPRYLINKTKTIQGTRQSFSSACKFSKLIYLDAGYIGLLSKVHNSFVLTNTDASSTIVKEILHIKNVVAIGKEGVATITENGQVSKFTVSKNKFSLIGSFVVSEDIAEMTGFDFDIASSQFAFSSPERIVLLNTSGQKTKEVTLPGGNRSISDEVITLYDFSNDHHYTLNAQNKTLKCFSVADKKIIWKYKCTDQPLKPRSMCLYENKLCIPWGDAIALFSAEDGKPLVKHDTKDLLDDCFGACIVDDVIVFSSLSDDVDTSAKLAFISV